MRIYKIFTLLLLPLILSSCAAVALVTATGLVVYDQRSLTTMEKDLRIFHLINNQIAHNPELHSSSISITSFNKMVLLTGKTPTNSGRILAGNIARQTPGVYAVYNEIQIGPPLPLAEKGTDTFITSKARARLLTKKNLESGSIRIVTSDRVIYLMGIVSRKQAFLAADAARRVPQVRKVVKLFKYLD